ncbi:IS110 family transposase [Streptomyces collinus]|uniref:IS110 family transposase n=1 Tax=Streptomyces collinus TaxID=42684 RepID=UPI003443EC03
MPGIRPVLAAVLVAEIGNVHRLPSADRLCSWVGLILRHYESDTVVRRGHVIKQGSKLVRWAVVEATQRATTPKIAEDRARLEARRGKHREGRRGPRTAHAGLLQRGRAIVWPPQRRGRGFDWPRLPRVISLHAAQRREGMTGSRVRPCSPASRAGDRDTHNRILTRTSGPHPGHESVSPVRYCQQPAETPPLTEPAPSGMTIATSAVLHPVRPGRIQAAEADVRADLERPQTCSKCSLKSSMIASAASDREVGDSPRQPSWGAGRWEVIGTAGAPP